MIGKLSDTDSASVADAFIDFSRYIFGHGDDHTEAHLSRMSAAARREYLDRCDDVLQVWRGKLAWERGDFDIDFGN